MEKEGFQGFKKTPLEASNLFKESEARKEVEHLRISFDNLIPWERTFEEMGI